MKKKKLKTTKEEDDDNDDVANEEDQSGSKKVTVNNFSTLHPPSKNCVRSPSKDTQIFGVCSAVVRGIH